MDSHTFSYGSLLLIEQRVNSGPVVQSFASLSQLSAYLMPHMNAYDALTAVTSHYGLSNDVDHLKQLHKWAEERMSVLVTAKLK